VLSEPRQALNSEFLLSRPHRVISVCLPTTGKLDERGNEQAQGSTPQKIRSVNEGRSHDKHL
jgi:hypothetical protein